MEEAPDANQQNTDNKNHLIAFSAKDSDALEVLTEKLSSYCSEYPDQSLANVSFTLLHGRSAFEKRRFTVAENIKDLKEILQSKMSWSILNDRLQLFQALQFILTGKQTRTKK